MDDICVKTEGDLGDLFYVAFQRHSHSKAYNNEDGQLGMVKATQLPFAMFVKHQDGAKKVWEICMAPSKNTQHDGIDFSESMVPMLGPRMLHGRGQICAILFEVNVFEKSADPPKCAYLYGTTGENEGFWQDQLCQRKAEQDKPFCEMHHD